MTSPQPFPSQPQASPDAGSGMQDIKSTLGVNQNSVQQMNTERLKKQQMETVQQQITAMSDQLDGIAAQFPASSQPVMALKQGMTKLLVLIVGSSLMESQPSTGAMG